MRSHYLALVFLAFLATAADWPQWRGPQRDGTSDETGLLAQWPKDGPPLAWRIDTLGAGYSGVAVVGDRLFVMGADDKREYLIRLSTANGKEAWRTPLGDLFKNPWGAGPRGTPTVFDGFVYALGAQGNLVCVEADSGKEVWRVDLRKDHAGKLMKGNILDVDWGYAESPLVDKDRVVVSPGGDGGTVAAFDRKTGKLLWRTKSVTDAASYSSVVAAEIHGVRQYVQFTGGVEYGIGALMKAPPLALGLSPDDGSVLWQHKINYITAGVINTPVVVGDRVYATCGYGAGCTILRIEKKSNGLRAIDATPKEARQIMKCYHGGVVAQGDRLFGFSDGRGWVCQKISTGESLWEMKGRVGQGSLIAVDKLLYIVTTDGQLVLAEPKTDRWQLRGQFQLPAESSIGKANTHVKVCTHPVVSGGRLFVRDQEILWCFDVRRKE